MFSKTTSRISKPLSVFDKLGVGSKYSGGGDSVSAHRVEKNASSQGMPKLITAAIAILNNAGKKRGL